MWVHRDAPAEEITSDAPQAEEGAVDGAEAVVVTYQALGVAQELKDGTDELPVVAAAGLLPRASISAVVTSAHETMKRRSARQPWRRCHVHVQGRRCTRVWRGEGRPRECVYREGDGN